MTEAIRQTYTRRYVRTILRCVGTSESTVTGNTVFRFVGDVENWSHLNAACGDREHGGIGSDERSVMDLVEDN